jgi:hypothetical protein
MSRLLSGVRGLVRIGLRGFMTFSLTGFMTFSLTGCTTFSSMGLTTLSPMGVLMIAPPVPSRACPLTWSAFSPPVLRCGSMNSTADLDLSIATWVTPMVPALTCGYALTAESETAFTNTVDTSRTGFVTGSENAPTPEAAFLTMRVGAGWSTYCPPTETVVHKAVCSTPGVALAKLTTTCSKSSQLAVGSVALGISGSTISVESSGSGGGSGSARWLNVGGSCCAILAATSCGARGGGGQQWGQPGG